MVCLLVIAAIDEIRPGDLDVRAYLGGIMVLAGAAKVVDWIGPRK